MIAYHLLSISPKHKVIYAPVDYSIEDFLLEKAIENKTSLAEYHKLSNPARKIEWLTIRGIISIVHSEDDDIIYDEHRKPGFIKSKDFLSISHSHHMVALSINKKEVTGIDIQYITDKILRIKEKFLNPKEQELVPNDPFELTCYWSIKEALFKVYGKKDAFLKENIEVSSLSEGLNDRKASGFIKCGAYFSKHELQVKRIGNYVLAYVVNH